MAQNFLRLIARLFLKQRVIEVMTVENTASETSSVVIFAGLSKVEFVTTDAPILTVAYSGNQVTITHAAGLEFRVMAIGIPLG